jgi:hypothetical protein
LAGVLKLCFGDAFVYGQHGKAQNSIFNELPAVGVALMAASKLEGRNVKWTQ